MIKSENERVDALRSILDREIEKNPHNRELIESFRPLLIARTRLLEKIKLEKAVLSAMDKTRFESGVPLIRQQQLLSPEDPWEKMTSCMIPALKEGFPGIRDDMDRLQASGEKIEGLVREYLEAFPDHCETVIKRRAAGPLVGTQGISLLLRHLTRIILEKRSQEAARGIKGLDWKKGYCPCLRRFSHDRPDRGEDHPTLASLFPVRS